MDRTPLDATRADMQDLRSLITRAQTGSLEAYGEIVRRFQDMAFGYAVSVLGDFHLAEDAAQEAFLEAYHGLPTLREAEAFPGWLRKIVYKHCDRLTRRKRVANVSLETAVDLASGEPGPPEALERREIRETVLAAIRALPGNEREATTLFYVNGYSQADIAAFLGLPVSTVNGRLRTARQRLKARMISMVSEELNAAKPGPRFGQTLERAITAQKDGRFAEALRLQESVLGLDVRKDWTADSYYQLAQSYYDADKPLELAEGILAGLPACAPAGQEREVIRRLWQAAEALLRAKRPERVAEVVARTLTIVETIKACADYRFHINEALSKQWRAALQHHDDDGAERLMQRIHANLADYENDLTAVCPGFACREDTDDIGYKDWFRHVANAFANAAHHMAFFGDRDKRTALRLMRRAADLCPDCTPAWGFLAAWTLSVEGNSEAALAHLKKARACPDGKAVVRNQFALDDFDSVREDAAFLAVVEG